MKKIIQYLFLLAGGSFILSSCNDFLDKEPLDSVTPDNFFFNESDLAAYAVKHYNLTADTMQVFGEMIMQPIIRLLPVMIISGFPVNGKCRKLTVIPVIMTLGILGLFVKQIIFLKQ